MPSTMVQGLDDGPDLKNGCASKMNNTDNTKQWLRILHTLASESRFQPHPTMVRMGDELICPPAAEDATHKGLSQAHLKMTGSKLSKWNCFTLHLQMPPDFLYLMSSWYSGQSIVNIE